jgi:hypothetical protein
MVVSGAEVQLLRLLIGSNREIKGEFGFLRGDTSGSSNDKHRDRVYLGLKLQPQNGLLWACGMCTWCKRTSRPSNPAPMLICEYGDDCGGDSIESGDADGRELTLEAEQAGLLLHLTPLRHADKCK